MLEYREKFLREIENILLYLIEFLADRFIILKKYSKNYKVNEPNRQPIIMITYNKSTFFANDSWQKVRILDGHGILKLKNKGKRIMVFDFLLPWSRLNLFSLLPEQ